MVCRYSCVETRALPESSQVGHSYWCDFGKLIIKYHDKALILPEFSFMKTVWEDEITQRVASFSFHCIPAIILYTRLCFFSSVCACGNWVCTANACDGDMIAGTDAQEEYDPSKKKLIFYNLHKYLKIWKKYFRYQLE